MENLTKNEMEMILGGGYWIRLQNGLLIYIDSDEEDNDEDIIFG